jgi:hypothetical protein
MSDRTESTTRREVTPEEMHTALFAQLVMQQTNLAMMLMGKVPHPESGEVTRDVDAARLFIDQLEMLEAKTKGNLTKEEAALLKQSLMNLRLTFVDAIESPAESRPSPKAAPEQPAPAKPAEEEHPKKFSKKY